MTGHAPLSSFARTSYVPVSLSSIAYNLPVALESHRGPAPPVIVSMFTPSWPGCPRAAEYRLSWQAQSGNLAQAGHCTSVRLKKGK